MKSLPYNVIITKSPRLLDTLFFPKNRARSSLDNFLKDLDPKERNDLLLLSPGRGYGFLELDVNFPEGGGSKYITLKLVESSELVDYFTLGRHPIDHVAQARVESDKTFSDNSIEDILRSSTKFYLSFGAGDDIRTWSGPYAMSIQNATIKVKSEGVREIELFFVPSFDSIKAFTNNFLNDGSYGQLESTFDSKWRKYKEIELSAEVPFEVENNIKPKSPPKSSSRWNYWVRALLREYLKGMFTDIPLDNIILLFGADLDRTPGEAPDTAAFINLPSYEGRTILDHAENLAKLGIQISPDRNTPVKKPERENTNKVLRNVTNNPEATVDTGNESLNLSNPQEIIPGETDEQRTERLQRSRSAIGASNGIIGVSPGLAALSDAEVRKLNQSIGNSGISKPFVLAPELHQNPDFINNQDTDFTLIKKAKISIVKTWTAEGSSSNIDSIMEPLYVFYRGVRRRRTKNVEFTLFEETDMKIKRFLKESNIIADPNETVIVFGEKEIIRSLMYPTKPYESTPQSSDFKSGKAKPTAEEVEQFGKEEAEKRAQKKAESKVAAEVGFESTFTFQPLGEADWVKYSKSFYNEFYTSIRGRTSSFGEKVDFGPFSKTLGSNLNDTDIVFMHNVKNSNVLNVSFENAGYKASLLTLAAESKLQTAVQNKKGNQILSDNRVKLSAITTYISGKIPEEDRQADFRVKILNLLREDEEFQRLVYDKGLQDLKVIDFLDVISFLVIGDALPAARPKIKVEPGDRYRVYSDMVEDLCKYTIRTEVKTLPFFNHPQLFDRYCFLFGLDNRIIGSKLSSDNPYAIFTGRYKIIGARHYLSNDNAFSNFKLVKVDAVGNRVDEASDALGMTVGQFIGDVAKAAIPDRNDLNKDLPFDLRATAERFEEITGDSFIPRGSKL
jgi:hypothetical protein